MTEQGKIPSDVLEQLSNLKKDYGGITLKLGFNNPAEPYVTGVLVRIAKGVEGKSDYIELYCRSSTSPKYEQEYFYGTGFDRVISIGVYEPSEEIFKKIYERK